MATPEPKSRLLGHSWPQSAEHLHAELCHRGTPWASRCVPLEVATGAGDVRSRHQGSGLQVMAKHAQDPQRLVFAGSCTGCRPYVCCSRFAPAERERRQPGESGRLVGWWLR